MRTRKPNSSPKKNQTRRRQAKASRKRAITWTDPTVPKTKVSKRRKTKLTKNDMKKNSCWWFG
jgi:hypothetical protein